MHDPMQSPDYQRDQVRLPLAKGGRIRGEMTSDDDRMDELLSATGVGTARGAVTEPKRRLAGSR